MNNWPRLLLIGAGITVLLAGLCLLAGFLLFRTLMADLPRLPEDPVELGIRPGTEIFAASGERIYTFNQSRQWVPLERIDPRVLLALIATEDASFYHHAGVDLMAIFAAVWDNLRQGYGARGGSTLTQQLVKRLFFSPEKNLRRKLSEVLLSLQLEALYARAFPDTVVTATGRHPEYKDRLLELYLNTVFCGANAYGISDAAAIYFSTTPDSLSLPQAALLMGLINAPTAYNPLQHPERATRRLQHVLRRMAEAGYLTPKELEIYAEIETDDLIAPHRATQNPAPYWVEAIKTEVARRWDPEVLRYGSLRIYTTLDMEMQQAAERAITRGLAELDKRLGFKPYSQASETARQDYVQAALVCLVPRTGQVRAMVGGRDIFVSYYNRALTARRQPGSGFKPVAYLAALEEGFITPVSLFVDEPRTYQVNDQLWSPGNFGDKYLGLTTAAWALVHSLNSVAVQVTERVGPGKVVEMARQLGFQGEIGPYMSIALGVSEVTVLEMASAYGALVTAGLHIEPTLVDSVIDAEGRRLFAHAPAIHQAVSPELAFQMVHLLRQAVDRGTGHRVREAGFTRPAAGKTGTTNDNTDAWFTGCTPELAASLWIGFDAKEKHRLVDRKGLQITGGSGAAPIWAEFMKEATAGTPETEFPRLSGVRFVEVDPLTGIPATGLPQAGLDDSTGVRAPLSVVLLGREKPNSPATVQAFEKEQGRARLDSLRQAAEAQPGSQSGADGF